MKVLLIGSYPPPLGGVSVFVKRYRRLLEREGHRVELIDPTRLTNAELFRRLLAAPAGGFDLISLNYPSLPVMSILLALGLASQTEVFDHNWRLLETWSAPARRLYQFFLQCSRELVVVAPHLKTYYEAHGVRLPAKVRVQHAFIPPPTAEETQILQSYPPDVREFVERRRPLVVANGFKIVFQDGIDLYGLDMCVELVAALAQNYPTMGLLFALAEIGDEEYLVRINERVAALDLRENFLLMTGQREIWPLFKRADLMVRPTAADGYAVSLAEALHFGCISIASDTVTRPAGTIIFKSRDNADFQHKCLEALAAQFR